MNGKFKTVLSTFLVIVVALFAVQVGAKEDPPAPMKMKKLKFPDFKEFTTDNGIEAIVVEHKEQPVVTIYCVIKTGTAADPDGKESLANFVADQLNKGTTSKSALELAEWIESVGGRVGGGANLDETYVSVTILSEYIDVGYEYLADVLLNPTFPQDEFEIVTKQAKTGLEFELADPSAMAQRHARDLGYGDHPYAKQPTLEAIEAITREDLVEFHTRNYVANNALFGVVGDVKWKDVRKALNNHFGEWAQGTPDVVEYVGAPEAGKTMVYLYHRPASVQTQVLVGHLGLEYDNPDWAAVTVGNRILGGGSDARLFNNLREDKGWTYGAYSRFQREKDLGYFGASMACRTEVTDSALVEMMGEIERIKTQPVSEEDLKNAKSYLIGNFPIQIETPNQIATRVTQNKLRGKTKKDLEEYRDKLAAVTIEDVSRVMGEYLHPDNAYIVLVGDAVEIQEKVAATGYGDVALFDIAGEPLDMSSLAVEPVDYEYDLTGMISYESTYGLKIQTMELGDATTTMIVKSEGADRTIEVTTTMAGMVSINERTVFKGDMSPVAYSQSLSAGPQKMHANLEFGAGAATGVVKAMDATEEKEIAVSMVEGTIIDGSVEFALAGLPLEVGKSYRFPVVLSDSGTLANLDTEIVAEEDIEVPAGTFSTFKVRVMRPEGEMFFYLDKEVPHTMIKMEVPAQAMAITLKSLTRADDSASN